VEVSSAPRTWLRRPSAKVVDGALAAVVAVAAVVTTIAGPDVPFGVLGLALVAPVLLWRRRRPVEALAAILVLGIAQPGRGTLYIATVIALFAVATRRSNKVIAECYAAAVIAYAVQGLLWQGPHTAQDTVGIAIAYAAAASLGLYVGARQATISALRDRAERLDRERELLAERAVADERVRIAQELHDVVAHNISLIVVQAQALGATVGGEVTSATDRIADLGREAMADMHRTLKLLRAFDRGAAARAPQPSLANLDHLLERSRSAGLDVALTVEGAPRELSQGVDLSAYRIVQEALTNVLRHAGPAATQVVIAYRDDRLELTVTNAAGSGPGVVPATNGGGHGLVGMRERTALFGGTLLAEPSADHGFRVKATLPYDSPGQA
jgi:signal transduction histidine kinase